MNEHTKQAALEALGKYREETQSQVSLSAWLRACEWMEQYATQAAYERIQRFALQEAEVLEELEILRAFGGGVLHNPDALKWRKVAAVLRALAHESGKGG